MFGDSLSGTTGGAEVVRRVGLVAVTVALAVLSSALLLSIGSFEQHRLLRLTVFFLALIVTIRNPRCAASAIMFAAPLLPLLSREGLDLAGLSLGEHAFLAAGLAVLALGDRRASPNGRSPIAVPLFLFACWTVLETGPAVAAQMETAERFWGTGPVAAFSRVVGGDVVSHFLIRLSDLRRPSTLAIHQATVIVQGALAFWILTRAAPRARSLARALTVSAAIIIAIGIYQWFFPFNTDTIYYRTVQRHLFRVDSTFPTPNGLGLYLVLVGPLGAVVAAQATRGGNRALVAALGWVLAASSCLALALSRSAIVGAVVGLGGAVLVAIVRPELFRLDRYPRAIRALKVSIATAAGLLIVLTAVATWVRPGGDLTYGRASSRMDMVWFTLDRNRPLREVIPGRFNRWERALEMAADAPVVGQGLSSYQLESAGPGKPLTKRYPPHNYFLGILAETGLIGFLLFLAVLVATASQARRAWAVADRAGRARVAAVSAGMASGLVALLAQDGLIIVEAQFVFWALAALLVLEERDGRATDRALAR